MEFELGGESDDEDLALEEDIIDSFDNNLLESEINSLSNVKEVNATISVTGPARVQDNEVNQGKSSQSSQLLQFLKSSQASVSTTAPSKISNSPAPVTLGPPVHFTPAPNNDINPPISLSGAWSRPPPFLPPPRPVPIPSPLVVPPITAFPHQLTIKSAAEFLSRLPHGKMMNSSDVRYILDMISY